MRLERSHFFIENAIQGEKLTVEEMDYKIDKKNYTINASLQQSILRRYLQRQVQKHLQFFHLRT